MLKENIEIKNPNQFSERFLTKFLENGFGALPKRELEVYLLHLLLEDGQFRNENEAIDFHEMSLALKMTETKVRNLVYEIELKYQQPINFSHALIELVEKQCYEVDKSRRAIKFSIQSPLLKQAFEYEVRQLAAISDGSFAKQVVTISEVTFSKLLNRLYGDKVDDEMLARVQSELNLEPGTQNARTRLFELFVAEFVKESGKKLAGSIFDSLNPVEWLKALK